MDFNLVSFITKKTKLTFKNTAIINKHNRIHCQINIYASSDVKYTIPTYKLRQNAVQSDDS